MATRPGHPSTHGHHINHITCGSSYHRQCNGFSGDGYDTYLCGCCCHDLDNYPKSVTDADCAWIQRVTALPVPSPEETTTHD
jgi:hypothetical protein